MDQAQKPPSGEKPEPGLQRKDLRKSSQAVRDKIGTALKKSMFVPLFDRMVDGEEESKNVLAVIDLANRGQTNLASELFGLRTRLRNLDAIDANVQVALFLQEAAALIPSLNKALAAEIIIGLEKAADNEAFFQIADAAVDKLLDSPSSLTRPIEKQLRDLRKVIDRKRREHEENRTITRPDGVKSALWQGIRAEPEDDEESGPKRRSETEIEKGARALGIVVCGFAGLIILLMIGSVMGHKDDSNEPAPQPKTEQPISAPVQAPPPQNEEPVPSVTILDVLPSAPKERKAPRPKKPKRVVQVPDASPPVQASNTDAGESPEAIAAAIINPIEGARERLAAIMHPDGGVPQEDRLAGVLKAVALGDNKDLAIQAIDQLRLLATQSIQPDTPARKALDELAADSRITSDPERSSALAIPKK